MCVTGKPKTSRHIALSSVQKLYPCALRPRATRKNAFKLAKTTFILPLRRIDRAQKRKPSTNRKLLAQTMNLHRFVNIPIKLEGGVKDGRTALQPAFR